MRKILFLCFTIMMLVHNAGAWTIVPANVFEAWGSPKIGSTHLDANTPTGDFRLREGWSIKDDDQSIVTLMARKIVERGGYFCMTQIYSASGKKFWTGYQQTNWPKFACAWLCEPGYEGENCAAKTSKSSACNTNVFSKSNLIAGSNDSIAGYRARPDVEGEIELFDSKYQNGVYEHDILLGVYSFLDNKHGIQARPIMIGAVGNHPAITYLTSQPANGGVMKTLCAQGFSNEGCKISSENCDVEVWCDGFEQGFNSNIHQKVADGLCYKYQCLDGLALNTTTHNCEKCDGDLRQGINTQNMECVTCDTGQYFDTTDNTCKQAKVLSKETMQYGTTAGRDIAEQCWTIDEPDGYAACVN